MLDLGGLEGFWENQSVQTTEGWFERERGGEDENTNSGTSTDQVHMFGDNRWFHNVHVKFSHFRRHASGGAAC